MLSLQKRLGSGLLISLAVVFVALWLITRSAVEQLAEENIITRLTHDSESLLSALSLDAAGQLQADTAQLNQPIYHRPFSGHYFRIQTAHNIVRSRSLWDQDLAVPQVQTGETLRLHTSGPQQQHLLVLVRGYQKQDTEISIAVAEDLTQLDKDIAVFQNYFAGAAAAMLLLLIVLQVLTLRRGLQPLHRITRQLRELEHGRRDLLETDVPAEIAPLVNELNRLVASNVQRLNRSRNAMADLAHALKRPLTVMQQHLQEHAADIPAQYSSLTQTQLQDMRESIEHILKRARLAGSGPAAVRFDPRSDVADLIDSLQHMYYDKQLRIVYSPVVPHSLAYDRQDMLELLGNLLDNACKWAQRQVSLAITEDSALRITVEDDGPGIAASDHASLLQRGKRLDESTEGHGLGLAIVKDIVDQYHGTLDFTRADSLGGLCVQVSLPLAE